MNSILSYGNLKKIKSASRAVIRLRSMRTSGHLQLRKQVHKTNQLMVKPDEILRTPPEIRQMIRNLYNNFGHLSTSPMVNILREAVATNGSLECVKAFKCEICEPLETHRPSRSAADARRVIVVDVCLWKHPISDCVFSALDFH